MTLTLKVLLVDDEALARSRLKTLLGDCTDPLAIVNGEAANATQALELLKRHAFDVILLDINLPGANGLTLATLLRDMPNAPAVVFVTAHAQHAVQAFELEALDYLTKPVRLERLKATLQKVARQVQALQTLQGADADAPEEVLIIQDRGGTLRVPLAQVIYLKAELKYVTVRTTAHSYIFDGSLSELEEKYKAQFMRIHRNALIARRAVRALQKQMDAEEGEGWAVRLDGIEELLFVSRRQVAAVREAIVG